MSELAVNFLLTLLVAAIGVAAKIKFKLSTNGYIAALVCVAIFNVAFGRAYFPSELKFFM